MFQPLGSSAPVFTTKVVDPGRRLAEIAMTAGDGIAGISQLVSGGTTTNFGSRHITMFGQIAPVRPAGVIYELDLTSVTFFVRTTGSAVARWLIWKVG